MQTLNIKHNSVVNDQLKNKLEGLQFQGKPLNINKDINEEEQVNVVDEVKEEMPEDWEEVEIHITDEDHWAYGCNLETRKKHLCMPTMKDLYEESKTNPGVTITFK